MRRGELSKHKLDADYPHQVALPGSQCSREHVAIQGFCKDLSQAPRGHTYFEGTEYQNVYCFAKSEDAAAFAEKFGGKLIDPKTRPKWPGKR